MRNSRLDRQDGLSPSAWRSWPSEAWAASQRAGQAKLMALLLSRLSVARGRKAWGQAAILWARGCPGRHSAWTRCCLAGLGDQGLEVVRGGTGRASCSWHRDAQQGDTAGQLIFLPTACSPPSTRQPSAQFFWQPSLRRTQSVGFMLEDSPCEAWQAVQAPNQDRDLGPADRGQPLPSAQLGGTWRGSSTRRMK